MKFIDLFAGLGGFHHALRALGHECVFASEIDDELRKLYSINFPESSTLVVGDIREHVNAVPPHDILCAGFPCQPFSKSGSQLGLTDKIRGTLFDCIVAILKKRQPRYVLLENVGNFERHDEGRTWDIVQNTLAQLKYNVRGTTHVATGGHGLISPHHLGYPQTRERFFIVASLEELPADPFPRANRSRITQLTRIVSPKKDLSTAEIEETKLTQLQLLCIQHWNAFIKSVPQNVELPSFPIWADEFGARYGFKGRAPATATLQYLRYVVPHRDCKEKLTRAKLISLLPSYARSKRMFPYWKVYFIEQNRRYYKAIKKSLPAPWLKELSAFPPSLRKLEWNCNGETRDLWDCVLQFRPSGLRAKRYSSSPALVAMTTTQIPILGPERRFITRIEGLRLQGFPDGHRLPAKRDAAFAALGNAVHTGVASAIASRLLTGSPHASEGDLDAWLAVLAEVVGVHA